MRTPVRTPPAEERTPWPPTDYWKYVDADLSHDWWTLDAIAGRPGQPWDVIVYNFNTREPDVVNWYLFNRLGCNVTTPDGANYRFGAYKPGTKEPDPTKTFRIYIPFEKWTPPTLFDEEARWMVIRTLTSAAAGNTHFSFAGHTLYRAELGRVASYIRHNRISVRYDPSLGDIAQYQPAHDRDNNTPGNTMYLGFHKPTSLGHLALIVHEAVHAAFDIRPVRHIPVEEDEGMAYVAQSLYTLHRGNSSPPQAAGDADRIRRYAAELVALAPDVIFAAGTANVALLLKATRSVPIVFAWVADPVGAGFVANLRRPGGNATGFLQFEYGLAGKWLELLKQIVPGVTRAAIMRDPTAPASPLLCSGPLLAPIG